MDFRPNMSFNTIFLTKLRATLALSRDTTRAGLDESYENQIKSLLSGQEPNLLLTKVLFTELMNDSFAFLESNIETLANLADVAFTPNTLDQGVTIDKEVKQYLVKLFLLSSLVLFSNDISSGEEKYLTYQELFKEIRDWNMLKLTTQEDKDAFRHLLDTYFNFE